jgi:predicted Zn-dependent protease
MNFVEIWILASNERIFFAETFLGDKENGIWSLRKKIKGVVEKRSRNVSLRVFFNDGYVRC